jgi:hypothetical protein
VRRYGDSTVGTRVVSGEDVSVRFGNLDDMGKVTAEESESAPYLGQKDSLFSRKTKPSAIGTGRRRADG